MHSEQLRYVLFERIKSSEPRSVRDSIFIKDLYSTVKASEKWDYLMEEIGVDVLEAEKHRIIEDNGKIIVLPAKIGVEKYLNNKLLMFDDRKRSLLDATRKQIEYVLTMDILSLEERVPLWPCLYGSSIMVNDVLRHIQSSRLGNFRNIGQAAYDYCNKYDLGGDNWELLADAAEQFICNSVKKSGFNGCWKFKRIFALMR